MTIVNQSADVPATWHRASDFGGPQGVFANPTLTAAFAESVRRHGNCVVVSDAGHDYTLRELDELQRRVARGMIALGVGHGERVAIWMNNRVEWIIAGLAIQSVGAVIVPIGTRLRAVEAAGIIRNAGVKLLISDPGFGSYDFVQGVQAEDLPGLAHIVVTDHAAADGKVMGWNALLNRGGATEEAELEHRLNRICPDDISDILFTSGTTGRPKGVPMTHRQSLIACEHSQRSYQFTVNDVVPGIFPFAHNAGYRAGWQMMVLLGFRVIPVQVVSSETLMNIMAKDAITSLSAVPTILTSLLDHPGFSELHLSALRIVSTGGTTVPVELIRRVQVELGAQAVTTAYGMTETAGNVSYCRIGDPPEVVAHTAGRPLENLDVKILGPDGLLTPPGSAGEICVRGPQVLKAYYDAPEATAAAFTEDKFFRTGDVGLFDSGGNLRITDRLKDMYICGGFNCYPAEIEQLLRPLKGIADVAVVGADDLRLGQIGCAFIVRERNAILTEADVTAFARTAMANYKVPRFVYFVEALPRTATGKVHKVALRDFI